ncbi:MAG TPA: 2OG-Fe(II) oxygenase [Xanthomonadaceae bacterium]|nr:2OG-Fe(II) oxygenase [Xanthomonadaceae bacterium]
MSAAIVADPVRQNADALSAQFQHAQPFRHVVIDGFLRPDYAERLLAEFPPFEAGNARNEAGELGNKSTVERVREIGPAYALLDDAIQKRDFLDLVGRVTGIPDLQYDPHYFGGGTHENRHGQDLDAHVDFNRHPIDGSHRRLNLIVYLNHEWQDHWGGSLQLHSDPRSEHDAVTTIAPLFNRCVIFETTEWSWHGFPPIDLPAERRQLTRKSVALYFYTRTRPAGELADTHSTIYVDRPLPARFAPGFTLGEADVQELRVLLTRRDMHLQRLYRDISSLTTELEGAKAALQQGPVGRMGWFARRLAARRRPR